MCNAESVPGEIRSVQVAGFEPAHQAWKACILTRLDDTCAARGRVGLVFKVRRQKRVIGGESEELPPIGMGFFGASN